MRSSKLLIPVVALLALAGAYWFLLLAPKREEAAALSTQITQKQAEVQQAEALLATYRAAEKTYKANYAKVARLGKAVPADDDIRSLVVQIEHAAADSKVDFRSINSSSSGSSGAPTTATGGPSAPPGAQMVGSAGFAVMPYTLNFEGNYLNLSKFFSELERFVKVSNRNLDVTGRLMRVENFTLAPAGDGGYPRLSAQVGATAYVVPPTEGLTAGATPQAPAAEPTTTTAITTGALR